MTFAWFVGIVSFMAGFACCAGLYALLEYRASRIPKVPTFDSVRVICSADCDVPELSR